MPDSTTPDNDLAPSRSLRDMPENQSRHAKPATAPRIQDVIGEGLRAMYESLKAEPIPDHLIELIRQMDKPARDQDR